MPAEARTAGGSGLGPGSVRTGVSGDDAAHSPAPDPQVVHAAVEQPARAGDTPGEPPIWRCTHDQPIERRHTPCQPRIGPNISRRSPRMLDQRGESVAGLDDAAPDSYSPSPEQWSSGLGGTGCASWRLDQLENIPWQTAAYVLTAGGSPPECDAALGLHPRQPSAASCVPGPTKRPDSQMPNNTVKSHFGETRRRSRSSVGRLARPAAPARCGLCSCVPPGAGAGFTMAPAGLRLLWVLRRALLETRTLLRHADAPNAGKPDSFGAVA
jgi:hypothetical protein